MAVDPTQRDAVKERFLKAFPVQNHPMIMDVGPVGDNINYLWRRLRDLYLNISDVVVDSIYDNADQITSVSSSISNITNNITNITNNTSVEKRFFGYDKSGGINLTTISFTDLIIRTEVRKEAPFIHALSSAEITIDETNNYEITVDCGFNLGDNGAIIELSIWIDDGTGYVMAPCSIAFCGDTFT